METKRCSRCGYDKPLEMFRRNHLTVDGYTSYCKVCINMEVEAPAGHKCCKKCGDIKPLREFHKQSANPDGYRNICKLCRSLNEEGVGYKKPAPEGYRYCSRCNELKPATHEYFYQAAHHSDNLSSACVVCERERYWENHDKNLEYRRKFYEANKDIINAARREAYAEDPEHVLARNRAWNERNPEKVQAMSNRYYLENRNKLIVKISTYQQENPDKKRRWQHNYYYRDIERSRTHSRLLRNQRKARETELPSNLTEQDWFDALEYFGYRCAICGRETDELAVLAMDHWIPLSDQREDNPGTVAENIVPLCHGFEGCNTSKGGREAFAWLVWKFDEEFAMQKLAEIETYFQHVRERRSSS
jgi:hypothetical protein